MSARHPLLQALLVLLLLTSALPPASASHLSFIGVDDVTADGVLEETLDRVGDARGRVDGVNQDANRLVNETRDEANKTASPNVTAFEETVEGGVDAWTESPLAGDTFPDVPRVWHATSRDAEEGQRSFWFGDPTTGKYPLGAHRGLVTEPIDLRGMIGTRDTTTTSRDAYGSAHDAASNVTGAAAGVYNNAGTSLKGTLTGEPPVTNETNLSSGVGVVTLRFSHRYDFSFNTLEDGRFIDGGRVEVRAQRPDGTWNDGDWEAVYVTTAHDNADAASRDPYQSPFQTYPQGWNDVAPQVEGTVSDTTVGFGEDSFICNLNPPFVNSNFFSLGGTICDAIGAEFSISTGKVDLEDPYEGQAVRPDALYWSLEPGEYRGRVKDLGWGFVGVSDEDGDRAADWTVSHLNLTDYAGEVVQVRFRAISSASPHGAGEGWFLDNITIEGLAYHDDVGVTSVETPRPVERVPPGTALPVEVLVKNYGRKNQTDVVARAIATTDASAACGQSVSNGYDATVQLDKLLSQEERAVAFPDLVVPDGGNLTLKVCAKLNLTVQDDAEASVKALRQTGRADENPANDDGPYAVTIIPDTIHDLAVVNVSATPRQSHIDEAKVITVHLENRGNVEEATTVEASIQRVHRETGKVLSWEAVGERSLTIPPGRHITSLGVADSNATMNWTWQPRFSGLYRVIVNVSAPGFSTRETLPTFVKASPAAYLAEDFEAPDLVTPNDLLVGAETVWKARQVPFLPAPYHGSTVWRPTLEDDLPSGEATPGGSLGGVCGQLTPQLEGSNLWWNPLLLAVRNAYYSLCPSDDGSGGSNDVPGMGEVSPFLDNAHSSRSHYYLARTIDLRDYDDLRDPRATLKVQHASTMNWLEGVANGNPTDTRYATNLSRGSIIIYNPNGTGPEDSALHNGEVDAEALKVNFKSESLPLMAAMGTEVAAYDSYFPWREEAIDLTEFIGQNVTIIFHYEVPPGRLETAGSGGQSVGTTTLLESSGAPISQWAERWLVDDLRVEINGVQVERDSVETAGAGWLELGWERHRFNNDHGALWHLEAGEGNPGGEAEDFHRGLWWGVTLDAHPQTKEFHRGYLDDTYGVAVTPPIDLGLAADPVLQFDHLYNFTNQTARSAPGLQLDGGNVRVRVLQADGTWSEARILGDEQVYNGRIYDHPAENLFGNNSLGFVKNNDINSDGRGDWQSVTMDLSEYRGKTIRVEFHAVARGTETVRLTNPPSKEGTNTGYAPTENLGWFIDNVRVQERRFANDIAVGAIVSPEPPAAGEWYLGPGTTNPFTVSIRNTGLFPHTEAGVRVQVLKLNDDGSVNATDPLYDHVAFLPEVDPATGEEMRLAPNGTYALSLPPWTAPDTTNVPYLVQAEAFLLRNGERVADEDPANDRLRRSLTLLPIHDVALTDLTITPAVGTTEPREISVTVENQGNMDERYLDDLSKFRVEVTIEDPQGDVVTLAPKPIGELTAGATWSPGNPWTWTPQDPIEYVVRAKVVLPNDRDATDDGVTLPVQVLSEKLKEDFEGDDSALTGEGAWSVRSGDAHSGERAWVFGGAKGYPNGADDSLTTFGGEPLSLRDARTAVLTLYNETRLEAGYDAGVVEACRAECDDPANWHTLHPEKGYRKLTTASPLVDDTARWAEDPRYGVGFTGESDGWERALFDLGTHDFLTERHRIFNDTFDPDVPLQERGDWSVWTYGVEPHSPGFMWFSTADYNDTNPELLTIESVLQLNNVSLEGVSTELYGRNAYLTFHDWRALGTAGAGEFSSIQVEITGGGESQVTQVRHKNYLNNYKGWSGITLPIDLQLFEGDTITIRFTHRINNYQDTVQSVNLGWAIDDVRIHAVTRDGLTRTIYGTDTLSGYDANSPFLAFINATDPTQEGPYWGATLSKHYATGEVATTVGGWWISSGVGEETYPGWTADTVGGDAVWRVGNEDPKNGGEPGNRYSRLITPLDLTAATDDVHLVVNHKYDFQVLGEAGVERAIAGGLVQVALSDPATDENVKWITLTPDKEQMRNRELYRILEYSHSPFGNDPEADSPFGPPTRDSPKVFAGTTSAPVVDVFDLTEFSGHRVWISFTAWTSCRQGGQCAGISKQVDTQSWTIHGVAVDGDVLQADAVHVRLRGVTDDNNPAAGWSVDDLSLLTASREYSLALDITKPEAGTRVAPNTTHFSEVRVRNTGIRPVEAQVGFKVVHELGRMGNWQQAVPLFLGAAGSTNFTSDDNVLYVLYQSRDHHDQRPLYTVVLRDASGDEIILGTFEGHADTAYNLTVTNDNKTGLLKLTVETGPDETLLTRSFEVTDAMDFDFDRVGFATRGAGAEWEPELQAWIDGVYVKGPHGRYNQASLLDNLQLESADQPHSRIAWGTSGAIEMVSDRRDGGDEVATASLPGGSWSANEGFTVSATWRVNSSKTAMVQLPGGEVIQYVDTVSLGTAEMVELDELNARALAWRAANLTHKANLTLMAWANLTGASDGRWEQILADNRDAVAINVTTNDVLRVGAVRATPNDVALAGDGATVRVEAELWNDSPDGRTIQSANATLLTETGDTVLALPASFAEVPGYTLDPFERQPIAWQITLPKGLPAGNYTILVDAKHEGGGTKNLTHLHVGHGNETFFSRSEFHPPQDREMDTTGRWDRTSQEFYNHTTYYYNDSRDRRSSWRLDATASGDNQQEHRLVTPWLNATLLDKAWLTFRHRYLLPEGVPGSAGAVVEIRNQTGENQPDGGWEVLIPEGGYPGLMRTGLRFPPTQNAPNTQPLPGWNPLVDRLCSSRKRPESPPCTYPGYVGQSDSFAVSGAREDGWETAVFDLTRATNINLTGSNPIKRFQIRFVAGVTAQPGDDAHWSVDYITVSPHRVLLGPDQSYRVQDGTDKTFRFTVENVGQLTDEVELRVSAASLPADWTLVLSDDAGNPLTDARGAPITNLTLAPGERRDVHARLQIPIERTFDSEREIRIAATSLRDPSRTEEATLRLDFQPRAWPDLAVEPTGVEVAAETIEVGQEVPVRVRVRNVGDTMAEDVVVRAVDHPEFGSAAPLVGPDGGNHTVISSLAAGEETTVSFQWVPRVDGNHTLSVAIDADDALTEYDEGNNRVERLVAVGAESLPDLRVWAEVLTEDGAPVEGAITRGDVVVVRAHVENHGTGPAAGVQASVLADAFSLLPELPMVLNGTIPPGESAVVEARWRAEIPGEYLLHVEAFSDWTLAPERTGRRLTDGANYTDDNFWRAPLTVRSPGLTLAPAFPDDALTGGERVALNLTVANRGNTEDAYRVTLTPPAGWTAAFLESGTRHAVFTLPSGGNTTLLYFVQAPQDAVAGTHGLRVTGVSHNTSEVREATVPLTVDRVGGLAAALEGATTPPGAVTVNATLTSTSNGPTDAALELELPAGWRADAPDTVRLEPFETRAVPVTLHAPTDTAAGDYPITLRATGHDDVTADAEATVTVAAHRAVALAPGLNDTLPVQRGVKRAVAITVANAGNLPVALDLAVDAPEGVEAYVEPAFASLEPGEARTATLHVNARSLDAGRNVTLRATHDTGERVERGLTLEEVATDVATGDMAWEPRFNIQAGTTMTFNTNLANAGDLTMDSVPIALFVDGHLVEYQTVEDLAPGETRQVAFQWTAESGEHDVWVVADPYEEVGEADESNNAVVETINVESRGPGFLRIFQDDGAAGDALETPGLSLMALLAAIAVTALAARKVRGRER